MPYVTPDDKNVTSDDLYTTFIAPEVCLGGRLSKEDTYSINPGTEGGPYFISWDVDQRNSQTYIQDNYVSYLPGYATITNAYTQFRKLGRAHRCYCTHGRVEFVLCL